jgi:hypothetical protein
LRTLICNVSETAEEEVLLHVILALKYRISAAYRVDPKGVRILPPEAVLANSMPVMVMGVDELFVDMIIKIMIIATTVHIAIFTFLDVCFFLGCGGV